jgi:hypothetical protein
MKAFPENEILLYMYTNKHILNWVLYNLPDLIQISDDLHDQGKFIPELGQEPVETGKYKSYIESQIINISRCERIVNIIKFEIDSLQEENLLLYWLKYREYRPLRYIAQHMKGTVYQVSKIEDNIRIQIYEALNREGITSAELFWFYEKFSRKVA